MRRGGRAAENKNYKNLTFACLYSDSPLGSGALGPLCAVNSWYSPKLCGVTLPEPTQPLPSPLLWNSIKRYPKLLNFKQQTNLELMLAAAYKSLDCAWHILMSHLFERLNFVTQLQASKNICFYYYWWNKGVKSWFIAQAVIFVITVNGIENLITEE